MLSYVYMYVYKFFIQDMLIKINIGFDWPITLLLDFGLHVIWTLHDNLEELSMYRN